MSSPESLSHPAHTSATPPALAIVGGGPAGLMAAECAASASIAVDLYDAMPSVGRKFLLAGKGGLNLTHAEPLERFLSRYGARRKELESGLCAFDAPAIRAWAASLGVETFIGSSQRIFPVEMKAAPLLRAWLKRLRGLGVRFHVRHRWRGWTEQGDCRFDTPGGEITIRPGALILALGGGSWARLGSDGAWQDWLREQGIAVYPLK
ncbi:MAG: TIGR03862 family flavoprotein, partial [Methylococcus sp.]